jgi:hypothetical protein
VQFTARENTAWYTRLSLSFEHAVNYLVGKPLSIPFVRQKHHCGLQPAYMLTHFIEETEGKMLSSTWATFSQDQRRRTNLFRDLSRIMLSLNKNPLPHIGSLTLDDNGVLSMANRPMSTIIPEVENDATADLYYTGPYPAPT